VVQHLVARHNLGPRRVLTLMAAMICHVMCAAWRAASGSSAVVRSSPPLPRCSVAPCRPRHRNASLLILKSSLLILRRTVRARHEARHSQRAIARELNIDRRKIKRMLDQAE
jgi:hypothetical protein